MAKVRDLKKIFKLAFVFTYFFFLPGKTVIVSLLTTMAILQGEKNVDVITSNAVLAQEGVDSRKLFYSLFNISVDTNVPDKTYAQGPRKCYLADVVYGSISDFQFDFLR